MARYGTGIWLALGVVYVAWGSTFIALAIVVRDLPPFLAMSARHLVAGGLLLAYALPRGREGDPVGRRQLGAAFVFGGLLFLIGHGTLAWGQQTVPAGVASLLAGSIPIWLALLDRVAFGRRLPVSAYLGFLLGFAGLAFLVDPFGAGSIDRVGALVILSGSISWSLGSLYSRRAPLPRRPIVAAGLGSLCGGLLCLVVAVASGELGDARVTTAAVLGLAYLIVVGSLAGFTAYVWLLRSAPTSLVATYAYVNPIVAVVLGWALLGEDVTVRMLVAGAAILIAVALIVRASAVSLESGRGLFTRARWSATPAEPS